MRGSFDGDGVSPCVAAGQRSKKRFPGRWSLRQLIYSSPILGRRRSGQSSSTSGSRSQHRREGRDTLDGRLSSTSKDSDRYTVEIHRATSRTSVLASTIKGGNGESSVLPTECPLCLAETSLEDFRELAACAHRACVTCFRLYLRVEITESRICIACPECHEPMHPNEIRSILDNPNLFEKYEDFMVRRVLAVDPDTRWCPAPDCGFAVVASECASCPKLRCERPGCDSFFCYHCKAEWHPNQTCDAARAQRSPHRHSAPGAAGHASAHRSSSLAFSQDSHRTGLGGDDMKPCPRCQVLIAKMDDGSCNHMMCAVCGAEFCWLCMKEINDLHFLSPSGCTFWGKKPWSRKKKILWQLGTLVGAPVGIALVAGITVPAMLIGIPVWVGKKLRARYKSSNKHKRHAAMAGGVIASVLIAPILAGLAVGIGVPILLFYVYGVVPVSLCRSGGCGGSGGGAADDDDVGSERGGSGGGQDASLFDTAAAKATDPSIGEASLSMASGSQVLRDADRESASTVALAGSISQAAQRLEVQADVVSAQRFSMSSLSESMSNSIAPDDGGASIRALAGSMLSYKPGDSDSCSCVTTEDCTSERVHFDDNVSFIASQDEKTSIGSSCSFRPRCSAIYIDIEEKPRKYSLQAAILRSQFFHSINDGKAATKSLDDKTIIEVSNETLDKQSVPLIGDTPSVVICQLKSASTLNLESSKL